MRGSYFMQCALKINCETPPPRENPSFAFNPLIPKSNQHYPESNIKVTKMKEMIIK